MPRILDYKIIDAVSGDQLEMNVKQAISEGWQPIGGMTLAIDADPETDDKGRQIAPKFNLGQAMVLYEAETKVIM